MSHRYAEQQRHVSIGKAQEHRSGLESKFDAGTEVAGRAGLRHDIGGWVHAGTILRLQAQAGNRAVQRAVQRQSPTTSALSDAQQWDQDWEHFPGQRHHFKGSGRPAGDPRARYDVLAPLYKAHGVPRPMVYLEAFITTATFYGFSTPAHTDLAAALATAEKALRMKGHTDAPIKKLWALNPRTTSSGRWSNHADGRAVDIDPGENPHITNRKERRMISLISGTDAEAGNQGYDAMKAASDAFMSAYNSKGLRQRIVQLTGAENEKRHVFEAARGENQRLLGERILLMSLRDEFRKKLQAASRKNRSNATDILTASELKSHIQKQQATLKQVQAAIKKQTVDAKRAESDLNEAAKNRSLLEKELQAYESTDGSIAQLETDVGSLSAKIEALQGTMTRSLKEEEDAETAGNSSGVARHRLLRATVRSMLNVKKKEMQLKNARLESKKKARKADPLRAYASSGFLNLSKDVVEAMRAANLKWGGNWKGAKDVMHFEL